MSANQKSAVFQGIEELTTEECLKIAQMKMKSSELEVVNVTMKSLSDVPVGFLGDHYKVKITILPKAKDVSASDSEVDLHFFVKTKPRDPSHSKFAESMGAFRKESDFFTTLLVLLRKYVIGEDVAEKTPWTAEFYHANSKLVVLDDLSQQGFRILANRDVMDFAHCIVLLRTLAKFHAASIIFEEKETQRLGKRFRFNETYPGMFKETIWSYDEENSGRKICDGGTKAMFALIKQVPRLTDKPILYERVKNSLENMFDEVSQKVSASKEFRNVVSHGDLWANNILFKYDKTGSKPEAAKLVDFQLLRYAPPAQDFTLALYLNTRREMREKHFHALSSAYHAALAEELTTYGLDAEEILPWSQFESSLSHYRLYGLLTCSMYFPICLMPPRVSTDLLADSEKFAKFMLEDRDDVTCSSFQTDDIYRERITEVLDELAELS